MQNTNAPMLVLEAHLHAKQALRAFGVQHIFVVGLRRRQDRRELMERQLRAQCTIGRDCTIYAIVCEIARGAYKLARN